MIFRLVAVFALCLCWSLRAFADVTFVSANGGTAASVNSITVSCNAGSGSDRAIYAWIGQRSAAITGATYAGVTMTQIAADTSISSVSLHMYRLVAPATGTNDMVFTLGSSPTQIAAGCLMLEGVDQTTPDNGAATKTTGTAATITGSVTSSAGGMVVGGTYLEQTTGTITADQDGRFELESVLSNSRGFAIATTAGDGSSKTISWAVTGQGNWREQLISVNAVGSVPASSRRGILFP